MEKRLNSLSKCAIAHFELICISRCSQVPFWQALLQYTDTADTAQIPSAEDLRLGNLSSAFPDTQQTLLRVIVLYIYHHKNREQTWRLN